MTKKISFRFSGPNNDDRECYELIQDVLSNYSSSATKAMAIQSLIEMLEIYVEHD